MMTAKRYFLYSFFLPLIVPLFAMLILRSELLDETILFFPLVVLAFSIVIGGLPYLFFLAGTIILLNQKSVQKILLFTWISPIIYCVILLSFVALVSGTTEFSKDHPRILIYSLMIGYGYVIAINVLYFTLKRFGFLSDEEITSKQSLTTLKLN